MDFVQFLVCCTFVEDLLSVAELPCNKSKQAEFECYRWDPSRFDLCAGIDANRFFLILSSRVYVKLFSARF